MYDYIDICLSLYICIHTYLYISLSLYIYIYICIHTHTHYYTSSTCCTAPPFVTRGVAPEGDAEEGAACRRGFLLLFCIIL